MSKFQRARYTLEFKLEAVRLRRSGQSMAAVAKTLEIGKRTLHNWIKAHAQGQLKETGRAVGIEQMEISRLRTWLVRVKMERDMLKKAAAYFARESMCSTPSSNPTRPAGRYRCKARYWA